MNQPDYPFFTRYGTAQFDAWFSDTVKLSVSKPDSWWPEARISWTRRKFSGSNPRLVGDDANDTVDVVITREEFMTAYHAADAFLASAEAEFLTATPVAYCTNEQAKEITRLANHPLLDRRTKTKAILAIPKLTKADAAIYLDTLAAAITALEGSVAYVVTGEAFIIDTKAA